MALIWSVSAVSCSETKSYSLKEASGFEASEITSVSVGESVYQSFAWPMPEEAYSYLDCSYIKVDFDINATYFSSWPPSELQDDAFVLHVEAESLNANGQAASIFVISHQTKYMYFDGLNGTYRSKDAMPSQFIDSIKLQVHVQEC